MKPLVSVAVLTSVFVAGSVWASGAMTPQQIVDDRVAGMKSLIGSMKGVGEATDTAAARDHLSKAISFAKSIPSRFPKGTGIGDTGVTKTRAKQEIWSKPAQFKTATENFILVLEAAHAAAGDKDKLSAAMADVKKSCGGCHDGFRGPEVD